jgi:hypothetical protein
MHFCEYRYASKSFSCGLLFGTICDEEDSVVDMKSFVMYKAEMYDRRSLFSDRP